MIAISTAKLPEPIRMHLVNTYPSVKFSFYHDMEQAFPHIGTAEILLTYGEDLTEEIIQMATDLKWIMVLSAGIDTMPLKTIKRQGILVTNSRGIHKQPMAEYAISMILQVSRSAGLLMEKQRQQQWVSSRDVPTQEISNKTMVIAGTGAIGQEVARLAKAFRMKTIGVSKNGADKDYFDEMYTVRDLAKVVSGADFIVSVLPSTSETKGFFRKEHFERMPETAIFLNMGRGDAVSEDTILTALDDGEIAHAVLDVFEQEPLPTTSPLWKHDKITITPHSSGVSPEYLPRAIRIFEENLDKYLSDDTNLINEINLDRGY
ncbi:D-2-hydroxyacid dehydrogenase [Sediminibacillus massiliensis]|uniref:D-2-hydroxyacid dehydrogenase n=1 Tax=Sediminibacillus massiliensis TaxID=1926277 RepID=UPI0009889230|nr:D-2-hydroxyacid dehydrogenase [Sediminibacillus massiliensis]